MTKEQDDKILVVGGDSMIGQALTNSLIKSDYPVIKTSRKNTNSEAFYLDLNLPTTKYDLPANISTAFLCAAITSIESCRLDPKQTRVVNVLQTEILAKQIVNAGGKVVFLSSNAVYDGSKPFRSAEEAQCPITEYGSQKAEVERRLLSLGKAVTIIRLTKILSLQLPLLANWIKSLKNGETITPRSDMILSPLYLDLVVNILIKLIDTECDGILQLSGKDDITYANLAQSMADKLSINTELVQPINNSSSQSMPKYSTLDTSRLSRLFSINAPSLDEVVAQLCDTGVTSKL